MYSNPNQVIVYDDGEVRQQFGSSEVRWVAGHDLGPDGSAGPTRANATMSGNCLFGGVDDDGGVGIELRPDEMAVGNIE